MLEVMEQCRRHAVARAGHVDRGSRHAGCALGGGLDEHLDRQAGLVEAIDHQPATRRPAGQQGEGDRPDEQWEPAPGKELGQVRGEEQTVDDQEQPDLDRDQPQRPLPHLIFEHAKHQRGDEHRAGHRDAIGCGEVGAFTEAEHEQDHEQHQRPVDQGHIDLSGGFFAGEGDTQARHQPKLDRLLNDRISAGDDRLAGDHGGPGGEDNQRQTPRLGGHQVKRALRSSGVGENQRALPEIVEQQRRKHREQPRQRDRATAEMAHVRIKCFGPGHREHDRAQCEERQPRIVDQKTTRP